MNVQGYGGQYDRYMDGHEATIDQAEMAARGILSGQQSRGERSNYPSGAKRAQSISCS